MSLPNLEWPHGARRYPNLKGSVHAPAPLYGKNLDGQLPSDGDPASNASPLCIEEPTLDGKTLKGSVHAPAPLYGKNLDGQLSSVDDPASLVDGKGVGHETLPEPPNYPKFFFDYQRINGEVEETKFPPGFEGRVNKLLYDFPFQTFTNIFQAPSFGISSGPNLNFGKLEGLQVRPDGFSREDVFGSSEFESFLEKIPCVEGCNLSSLLLTKNPFDYTLGPSRNLANLHAIYFANFFEKVFNSYDQDLMGNQMNPNPLLFHNERGEALSSASALLTDTERRTVTLFFFSNQFCEKGYEIRNNSGMWILHMPIGAHDALKNLITEDPTGFAELWMNKVIDGYSEKFDAAKIDWFEKFHIYYFGTLGRLWGCPSTQTGNDTKHLLVDLAYVKLENPRDNKKWGIGSLSEPSFFTTKSHKEETAKTV